MHLSDDPRELQRQIELATRIASSVTDQTTVERLKAWIEEAKAAGTLGGKTPQA